MKSFYEMLELMEQVGMSSVERFPQDFEQVLNFIAGGPWSFVQGEFSPFYGMDVDKSGSAFFYLRADYRGMSESGGHYKVAVRLCNSPNPPINRDGAVRFGPWKKEFVSYDPKGSSEVHGGLPAVFFELYEVMEIGADTDGRDRNPVDSQGVGTNAGQDKFASLIGKLNQIQTDLDKDHPRPKYTPERTIYITREGSPKHLRPVDLAKQVRDEMAKHEKIHPSFESR